MSQFETLPASETIKGSRTVIAVFVVLWVVAAVILRLTCWA
jgi:hypothetical protein